MLRFVELSDGSFRLTYVNDTITGIKFDYVGRFQPIENDPSIPEKEDGFRIVLDLGLDED